MSSQNTNPNPTDKKITLTQTETTTTPQIPLPAHHPHPSKRHAPQPNPSTPLYFAYGSNLSPTQMRSRCAFHPSLSGKPVALARLEGWRWFICDRGYANVFPPGEMRWGRYGEQADGEGGIPASVCEGEKDGGDVVYGVLYEMARDDERLLDGYEGVDWESAPADAQGKVSTAIRPREQGSGDYNKWYLPARVTKWLDEEQKELREGEEEQTVLVYVDEKGVRAGPPKREYIARMDRGVREAEELGFPSKWATQVMRRLLQ